MKTIKSTKAKTTPKKTAAKAPPAVALTVAPARKRSVRTAPVKTAPTPERITRTASRPGQQITTELIAARAFIIWEQQGRPHGSDVSNWLLAESQLKQENQPHTN